MSIKLHGREYVEVKDRVAEAHNEDSYSMLKEETFSMGGREYCRVYIDVKGKQYIGTAECKFNANPKTPDGQSPFECGETSALGRALGFAGYGAVESIASADEVVRNQEPVPATKPISALPVDKLEPLPMENMSQLLSRCRLRATKLGYKMLADYHRLCQEIIGKDEPETLADVSKLNAMMQEREQKSA
jgi:hypothetical protein